MPRTRSSKRNQPQPAAATTEAAGLAAERLIAELAAERDTLGMKKVAQEKAEVARLEARLAEARQRLARAEQAAEANQQRCSQLGRELQQLGPRLGYNFDLPQDASLAIIGQLGVARCRAAGACRRLRAAVGSAQDLGAFKHKVLAVCAGGAPGGGPDIGHTVVCTGDAVFSFGCGDSGQLGYAAEEQATSRVVTGLLDQDVVAAAASAYSTLVCTAQGQACWFGALGEVPSLTSLPTLVGGLQEVVGVAAGRNHLLAWTRAGQLYTWGYGAWGQLGHDSDDDQLAPRLVEGLVGQEVVGGDGSEQHSVVCTASGRVYTFGEGAACLGHGQDALLYAQLTPRLVEALVDSTVVAVGAGQDLTAAITEARELYTWGGSDASGHGEEPEEEFLPRLVAGLAGKRVAGFAAGDYHMLAWTDSGELYSWGCGDHGQLGHNSQEDEWSPRRVEALAGKMVVGAAGGYEHSVVVTRDQKVYGFGNGESGQLGQGPELEDAPVPKEVGGLRTSAK